MKSASRGIADAQRRCVNSERLFVSIIPHNATGHKVDTNEFENIENI